MQGSIVADVGTDHGLLPIYLARISRLPQYGIDKNRKAIEMARQNLYKYGQGLPVHFFVGDGLSPIQHEHIDACVMAGMGARNIVRIFEKDRPILRRLRMIVVQPMQDKEIFENWIKSSEFRLAEFLQVDELDHLYTVYIVNPKSLQQ